MDSITEIRSRGWVCLIVCIVLAFGAAPALAQAVKLAKGAERLSNTDRPGSDIAHYVWGPPAAGSLDLRENQCADTCAKNKDCVAWTYVKPNTIQGPNGNCWIKNAVPAAKANNCCTTGTIGEVNTDRPGSDYKHFTDIGGQQVTASLCEKACFQESGCKSWTFVKPNTIQGPKGVCWLKNSVPSPKNNGCCMSGYFETTVIH